MAEDRSQRIAQARRLAAVLVAVPDERACLLCLDRLDAYVAAQFAQDVSAHAFRDVMQHLDACVRCAESYALLYQGRVHEEEDVALPAHIPDPDLRFLVAAKPGAMPRVRTKTPKMLLLESLQVVGAQVRIQLSQALLSAFPPSAAALRGDTAPVVFDLVFMAPHASIARLRLSAVVVGDMPERWDLRVLIVLPERDWPDLAGIPLTLMLGETPHRALTDPWGEAIFAAVPAAQAMRAEVQIDILAL